RGSAAVPCTPRRWCAGLTSCRSAWPCLPRRASPRSRSSRWATSRASWWRLPVRPHFRGRPEQCRLRPAKPRLESSRRTSTDHSFTTRFGVAAAGKGTENGCINARSPVGFYPAAALLRRSNDAGRLDHGVAHRSFRHLAITARPGCSDGRSFRYEPMLGHQAIVAGEETGVERNARPQCRQGRLARVGDGRRQQTCNLDCARVASGLARGVAQLLANNGRRIKRAAGQDDAVGALPCQCHASCKYSRQVDRHIAMPWRIPQVEILDANGLAIKAHAAIADQRADDRYCLAGAREGLSIGNPVFGLDLHLVARTEPQNEPPA